MPHRYSNYRIKTPSLLIYFFTAAVYIYWNQLGVMYPCVKRAQFPHTSPNIALVESHRTRVFCLQCTENSFEEIKPPIKGLPDWSYFFPTQHPLRIAPLFTFWATKKTVTFTAMIVGHSFFLSSKPKKVKTTTTIFYCILSVSATDLHERQISGLNL